MNALLLTSGGLIAARVMSAWLSAGNKIAAIWIGRRHKRLYPDVAPKLLFPSWSVASLARRHRIPIRRNPDLARWTGAEAEIGRLGADVLITAITYQIVPERLIAVFGGRAVNFHTALLPHYRGPHPLQTMILDGKAEIHGGVTVHCLSRGIDEGDIIGVRKLPYDPALGYIHWQVALAREAGALVTSELKDYLEGRLTARPQQAGAGCYRKAGAEEVTLSAKQSAAHIEWLCGRLGDLGILRYLSGRGYRFVVLRFLHRLGPPTGEEERIGRFAIEFDARDARVQVGRKRRWTKALRRLRNSLAIARTARWGFVRVLPGLRLNRAAAFDDQEDEAHRHG